MMRAVLWCNGDSPNPEMVSNLLDDATLFGVDGGTDKAIAAGFEVSAVLGDLDSVNIADWKGHSTLLSDDSSSDLAKSFALIEAPPGISIKLHHSNGITKRLHPNDGPLDFVIPRGDEFSVFALEDCQQVSISGGRWNLDSEPMNFSTKGLHNQSLGEEISISTDGILAIIFQC